MAQAGGRVRDYVPDICYSKLQPRFVNRISNVYELFYNVVFFLMSRRMSCALYDRKNRAAILLGSANNKTTPEKWKKSASDE